MSVMKTCQTCAITKPLEAFGPVVSGRDGLDAKCRSCRAELARAYRKAHPEKIRAANATYYATNTEAVRAQAATWYAENEERARSTVSAYRAANPEKVRVGKLAYVAANVEKVRQHQAEYHKANAEVAHADGHVRRDRSGLPTERVLISVLYERDNGICAICRTAVDKHAADPFMRPSHDHIIAVALGGSNTYANAQLAHRRCNSVKGNQTKTQMRMESSNGNP